MNVIDALFITLGLDTRDYEKKQKEAEASLKKFGETSDKQTKLIAESGKKAASAFSALKIEILGAIAAYGLGDGIKNFIESNVTGNAELGRMSRNLRMSAADLKAWGYAAQSVGGNAEDATNALQSVAKGIADAKLHGSSPLIMASNRYGARISGNDTAEQAMLKINRAVYAKEQRYGAQQAMAIAGELGVGNYHMQQLMLMRPDKFQELLAHYREKAGHIDTKDAIAFQGTLTDIRADIGNLRDDLFGKMAPAMEVFAKKFEAFLDKITPKLEALVERFANWLASLDWDKVIADLELFIGKVQRLVQALGGIKGVLIDIAAIKVFGWVASIGGWIIQLRALTAALTAARAAAAAGAAGGTAEGMAAGVAGGSLMRLIPWALPIWTLFHSENLGGKQRADGTYEDEALSAAQLAVGAKDPRAAAFQRQQRDQAKRNRDEAIRYFMSQGFSRNAAIGMAANIARESSFNPHAAGDNGNAYGIGQWHPARQADFARVMGLPIQASSYQQQLAFYAYEVKHNKQLMDKLSGGTSAGAAAMLVSMLNERPADAQGEAQRRALLAQQMSNAYVGAARTASAAPTTSTNTVTINGMTVNTKATDANGIAKDMRKAMLGNPLIAGYATVLR